MLRLPEGKTKNKTNGLIPAARMTPPQFYTALYVYKYWIVKTRTAQETGQTDGGDA